MIQNPSINDLSPKIGKSTTQNMNFGILGDDFYVGKCSLHDFFKYKMLCSMNVVYILHM